MFVRLPQMILPKHSLHFPQKDSQDQCLLMWEKAGQTRLPSDLLGGEWKFENVSLGFKLVKKRSPAWLLSLEQESRFYVWYFISIQWGDGNDKNTTKQKEVKVQSNQRTKSISAVNPNSWWDQGETTVCVSHQILLQQDLSKLKGVSRAK